jgi:hypothetical protein
MKLEITRSDWENHTHYTSVTRCPMACAMRRVFGEEFFSFCHDSATLIAPVCTRKIVKISPGFRESDYIAAEKLYNAGEEILFTTETTNI